jgi:hypothetical protein
MPNTQTAISLLRAIIRDGYLSDTNVALAREVIEASDTTSADIPDGMWRDQLVGMRFVDGVGWRPAVRDNPEAVYLASDVHQVLIPLLARLGTQPEGFSADLLPGRLQAANAMARACDRLVQAGLIDPRSELADARLKFGDPFTYD